MRRKEILRILAVAFGALTPLERANVEAHREAGTPVWCFGATWYNEHEL